jgi:cytochrome c553
LKKYFSLIVLFCLVSPAHSQDANRGKELYASCVQCHGENGLGNVEKNAPKIAGQFDWYIISSIEAFQAGKDRKNPDMLPYIKNLSSQDIKDLAAFVSTMK